MCASELFVRGGELIPVQTEANLKHQRLLWQFEANGFVFIDGSCDIEREAHSSNLPTRHPLAYGCEVPSSRPTRLSISLVNDLFIIPWRTEVTFAFCFQVCIAFAVVRRVFWGLVVAFWGVLSGGDIPREVIMVLDGCDHPCLGEQLWEQLWLTNRGLLKWSRWRANNKQGFSAPPHRVFQYLK